MSRAVQGSSQMFPPAVQAFILLGLFLSWNENVSMMPLTQEWELTDSVDAWLRLFSLIIYYTVMVSACFIY